MKSAASRRVGWQGILAISKWVKTINLITKEIAQTINLYPECLLNIN
ncbi:MAG: hypothetical protein F6K15_34385 [Okeania sp. SIO2B3]|nr:hypothetical protein [Okeania sp. SIO2B3]